MKIFLIILLAISVACVITILTIKNMNPKIKKIINGFNYLLLISISLIFLFSSLNRDFRVIFNLIVISLIIISYLLVKYVIKYSKKEISENLLIKDYNIFSYILLTFSFFISKGYSYIILLMSLAFIIGFYLLALSINKKERLNIKDIIYVILAGHLLANSIGLMIFSNGNLLTIFNGLFVFISVLSTLTQLYVTDKKTSFKDENKYYFISNILEYCSIVTLLISLLFI